MLRKRMASIIISITTAIILCLTFGLGISSLLLHSEISFSFEESITYHQNDITFYILLCLSILIIFCLLKLLEKMTEQKLFLICSLIFLIGGIILIVISPNDIRADAKIVFNAATSMNNGDYSALNKANYLGFFPYQLGLVSYDRMLLLINDTPRVLYAANIAFVIGINYFLWRFFSLFSIANQTSRKLVIVGAFLFVPQFFFILFGYGNVPGFFFFMLSCFLTQKFLKTKNKVYLWLSIVSISVSCLLKDNYLIGAIAISCIYILFFLKKKSAFFLLAAGLMLVMPNLSSMALTSYYSNVSGINISKGIPKILWITMGLQEDPNSKLEAGWYNAYPKKIYRESDLDGDVATEIGKNDLKEELSTFIKSPSYAVNFFSRKIFSTWLEPSYQSVWSTPLLEEKPGFWYDCLLVFMHIFITFIFLFSAFYYALCFIKRIVPEIISLLPGIYFVGGFMFHLFWETKSQYVYQYVFVLIIPAAIGLSELYQKVYKKKSK